MFHGLRAMGWCFLSLESRPGSSLKKTIGPALTSLTAVVFAGGFWWNWTFWPGWDGGNKKESPITDQIDKPGVAMNNQSMPMMAWYVLFLLSPVWVFFVTPHSPLSGQVHVSH